jgi:hypothetical protein
VVSHESAGFIQITVKEKGVFSGKVLLDGNAVGFSGKSDAGGHATPVAPRLVKLGKANLALSLDVDLGNPTSDLITGTISDGVWTSEVKADKAVFSLALPETNYVGTYTMKIPRDTNGPVAGPGGPGYACITNSPLGFIKINAGNLGDTAKLAGKWNISKDGYWPLYAPLYKDAAKVNKGSLFGWVQFTTTNPPTGNLSWIKTTNVVGVPLYPDGFTNLVGVAASPYVAPLDPKFARVLELTSGTLTFSDGNLLLPMSPGVEVEINNKAIVSPNAQQISLKFAYKTGKITGAFLHPDNGNLKTTFNGAVLQNQTNAFGNFPGTSQSGTVIFE